MLALSSPPQNGQSLISPTAGGRPRPVACGSCVPGHKVGPTVATNEVAGRATGVV